MTFIMSPRFSSPSKQVNYPAETPAVTAFQLIIYTAHWAFTSAVDYSSDWKTLPDWQVIFVLIKWMFAIVNPIILLQLNILIFLNVGWMHTGRIRPSYDVRAQLQGTRSPSGVFRDE